MKEISSALVVLAGAIMFVAGALVSHSDTQTVLMFIAGGVSLVGIWRWLIEVLR